MHAYIHLKCVEDFPQWQLARHALIHTYTHTHIHEYVDLLQISLKCNMQSAHIYTSHTYIQAIIAYIHSYIHSFIHRHTYTCTHAHIRSYFHTYTHTHIHTYTHTGVRDFPGWRCAIHVDRALHVGPAHTARRSWCEPPNQCLHVNVMYMYAHAHVYIYIYIYIYTYSAHARRNLLMHDKLRWTCRPPHTVTTIPVTDDVFRESSDSCQHASL